MEAGRKGCIVDAKLTITNVCGAKCATCPNWKQPARTMKYEDFKKAWEILNSAPGVDRILVNNVGDVNELPDAIRYLTHMEKRKKQVAMTTNGNSLEYVPKIDVMIISFNGGTKESFEKTTGMDFDRVVGNIRAAYEQLKQIPYVELDCLVWKGNEGTEMGFYELWKDFPGRLRLSYKVENQGGPYFGIEKFRETKRIYCQYLDWLSIAPSGQVISCAHDFAETTNWGNIYTDKMSDIVNHPERIKMQEAHRRGEFPGLCETCNFNVPEDGKIVFLK
jgi:radical SAM protein with 4Fe4S-binding SPASM domain